MVWHYVNNVIHVRLPVHCVICIWSTCHSSLMFLVLEKKSYLPGCAFHFYPTLAICGILEENTCVCLFAVACERPKTYP